MTLEQLTRAALSEDNIVDVNPIITAIRVEFGPEQSSKVFMQWRDKYGWGERFATDSV